MLNLLLLQFIAHFLADFHFQPQKWCEKKDRNSLSKEHIWHFLVVFTFSYLLCFEFSFWWGALIIAVSHLIIDVAKSVLGQIRRYKKCKPYLFFIDQVLHLAIIVGIVDLYSSFAETSFPYPRTAEFLFLIFSLILCTKPTNLFIRKFIELNCIVTSSEDDDKSLVKAGRIIGSLERILSFILIVFNQFAAVGFLIAAKSILRFRDTQTAKTEYLLIGSLLSFGMAIILGITYRLLFHIPYL